jgi:hypothetical protein
MTHRGSCHCGRVRFTCELDLAAGGLCCGCSMCTKGRIWLARVPPAGLDILRGETALNTYEFGDRIRHHFCAVCGIQSFAEVLFDDRRGVAVNLACLDDFTAEDWAAVANHHAAGRHDPGATAAARL